MLRTAQEWCPLGDSLRGAAGTVRPSIETDDASDSSFSTRAWRPAPSRNFIFPELEQSRIYHEWISAGKPHNFVCSECHLPENLIGCRTCCRSYHAPCLSSIPGPAKAGDFNCPSCIDKAWDRAPPQFIRPASTSSNSRVPTPAGNLSQAIPSPSGEGPVSAHVSPLATRHNSPGCSSAPYASDRLDSFDGGFSEENLPPIPQMYPHILAHLSSRADGDSNVSMRQPEFLRQLDLMMREVESHRSLLQKTAVLREEFTRDQTENAQIRTYLNSRLPSREPALASPSIFSPIPRPSADTSGRSWDSIVMDLI